MARGSGDGHRVDCSLGLALPRRTLTLVSGFFLPPLALHPLHGMGWLLVATPMGGSPRLPSAAPGVLVPGRVTGAPGMGCLGVGM